MASLNTSHHQDGGVLLYNGEFVLLYCDKVNCEVDNVGNATGRMFLTTHRILFTAQPINQRTRLQSLAAPFYAMFDLGLEQPVFGANYIRGKVRTNSDQNTSPLTQNQYTFKLKFNKGGAIEFGKAMTLAAKQASQIASQTGFNTYSFNTTPASQYYQAPSEVYQPNYPIGFVLPNQVFNEVPTTGTIYYQNAPPPYPGLVPAHQMNQPQNFGNTNYGQVYPVAPVPPVATNSIYETNVYPRVDYSSYSPNASYPNQTQNQTGYMPQSNPPSYQQASNPYQQANNQYQQDNNQYQQANNQYQQANNQYQQQRGYQPESNFNNNYQPQYPRPPQQSGYVPQSNNTYPNIPSYEDAVRKEK